MEIKTCLKHISCILCCIRLCSTGNAFAYLDGQIYICEYLYELNGFNILRSFER